MSKSVPHTPANVLQGLEESLMRAMTDQAVPADNIDQAGAHNLS